jgi:hypothetical protein
LTVQWQYGRRLANRRVSYGLIICAQRPLSTPVHMSPEKVFS